MTAALPAAGRPALTLASTLAIQMLATAATLSFAVLAPVMPGIALTSVGLFLSLVYLGGMAGSLAGAGMVAAWGPVRASQLGLLAQAAALGMLATGVPELRPVAALASGLGYGPITPASSQILARTTSAGRMGFVFSLKQTGVPLGGLLAGALLPPLAAFASWQAAFGALAAAALAVAALSQSLRATHDDATTGRFVVAANLRQMFADVLGDSRLRSMAAVSLLFSACQLSVSGYLMAYLTHEIGIGLTQAGLIYAVAQGAGIAGRLAWGHLADLARAPRGVLILLAVLMSAGTVATGMFTAQWTLVPLCLVAALLGATAIGWNGVYLGEVARLAPPGRVASVTGGALFCTYFGVVAGPAAFGYFAQRVDSLSLAYMALAGVPVLAAALLYWGGRAKPAIRANDFGG
ncbi:MFS transporter [Cupriavidus sp.]|uniref:MFS transporter n=1 Tax=Cupriavidus sp. TaxID=1873897 RepID=UPI0025C05B61|nr:MFS transporter [Cupriavidus sp.]MCA3182582.1 MFS transporter [Cupriavidus sp.]MCA3192103.1 MFS transporter [Cupriavidus sp.]MCA3197848.1 MFS transporter [Cupriavidus sp.]MCA3202901.1 MFS transporter [Cupriavidus sp.]MCA3206451.1 MFS transporter [Cupriavidus sp.]